MSRASAVGVAGPRRASRTPTQPRRFRLVTMNDTRTPGRAMTRFLLMLVHASQGGGNSSLAILTTGAAIVTPEENYRAGNGLAGTTHSCRRVDSAGWSDEGPGAGPAPRRLVRQRQFVI